MNALRYRGILYFIALVIGATLCIQGYWNYKNYRSSKQQLLNDVQTSLDNAVDQYYTNLATRETFRFKSDSIHFRGIGSQLKSTIKLDSFANGHFQFRDSLRDGITIIKSGGPDSIDLNISVTDTVISENRFFAFIDSLERPVEQLSSKLIVSFSENQLSLQKIDSLFQQELLRKNIQLDYGLSHEGFLRKKSELRPEFIEKASLETTSKSPYFFYGNELKAHFNNLTFAVLKRNVLGILLSFVLLAGVIGCLLYLLKIIQQQKQLAEVKNDLINNITHEFKTPIATIGVAMEGILKYNTQQDPEKTQRYAKMSEEQLQKLNVMVEKLLETAALDSDQLVLKKEMQDIVGLLERLTQNEVFLNSGKTVSFTSSEEEILLPIDQFHIENALNNILDNALKYGGKDIKVEIEKITNQVIIKIADSGSSLQESHKKQVFEKFYRVPKGNTHDVKGFGIGLHYTQKIIEKHGGSIMLIPQPNTRFKITLPIG